MENFTKRVELFTLKKLQDKLIVERHFSFGINNLSGGDYDILKGGYTGLNHLGVKRGRRGIFKEQNSEGLNTEDKFKLRFRRKC